MAARTCAYAAHHMFRRYGNVMASMFQRYSALIGVILRSSTIGVSQGEWLGSRLLKRWRKLRTRELGQVSRCRWEGASSRERSPGFAAEGSMISVDSVKILQLCLSGG